MMFRQTFGRNNHGRSGFLPAVAGLFLPGNRMGVFHLAEARPGIGEERVLIGLQRQAPVAAARVDRCHRAAVAVQRIARHDLAL